ncbi:MAG: histidine kinase [Candidatus Kapabacteria bacterium]|jgi:LytS/YehU family sensor histidine kinase|nr:histidine kinase [Candidatus Kapabacteria bacterium]
MNNPAHHSPKQQSTTWHTILVHSSMWFIVVAGVIGVQFINGAYPRLIRTVLALVCIIGGYYLNAEILVERFFEKHLYLRYCAIVVVCIISAITLNFTAEMVFAQGEIINKFFIEQRRYFAALISMSLIITLVGLVSTTQRTSRRRESEAQELLTKHKEAELLFLRSQINPHFLFNTLNNIYSLAISQSPQTAPMLMRLSKLLRYSIYSTQKQIVPLIEEINEIQELLSLFQLRSEEPMKIEFTTEGSIIGQCIEPMILFSLVENCLKHSDITHNPKSFIAINLAVQNDILYFTTRNSKDPTNTQKDGVGGVGLHNIRQRLALKYGKNAALITNDTEREFEVVLTLPIQTA